ncbi:MAG: cyclase family protein [Bacilli bacterium]|nr:cyclase family protein [Bacilli bacterium]
MKVYDISMVIDDTMPVYKNLEVKKPKTIIRDTFENSNHYETSMLLDMHTGTHIDAPLHMIKDGQPMKTYKVEDFITKCKVLDFTDVNDKITINDLQKKDINRDDFILLKTKNSQTEVFEPNFIYLDKDAAYYLKQIGIKGVGTDGLGIERNQKDHETHLHLLGNNIMVIEGLRLKDITEGSYTLIILPLKILHTEACPARAILIEGLL